MSLTAGTSLGSYEVVVQIGAGGMGEVYEAKDTKLGRNVAIKVLPTVFANDPERLARFQREAKRRHKLFNFLLNIPQFSFMGKWE